MLDKHRVVCYNNYTETAKEISTMTVPASYTLDAPTFNSNVLMLIEDFNFTIRKTKTLPMNRILVSVRFVDESAKTKFDNYLFESDMIYIPKITEDSA